MIRYPDGFSFREWFCTGDVTDHDEATHECQLCGMTGLRYHFEIRRKISKETMQVGSDCILRFDIAYYKNGALLDNKVAVRNALQERLENAKRLAAIAALQRLASAQDGLIASAIECMQATKPLTPRQASAVLWLLDRERIEHSPPTFKVRLKRDKDRSALTKVVGNEAWRLRYLWPALTPPQRELARRLGLEDPFQSLDTDK